MFLTQRIKGLNRSFIFSYFSPYFASYFHKFRKSRNKDKMKLLWEACCHRGNHLSILQEARSIFENLNSYSLLETFCEDIFSFQRTLRCFAVLGTFSCFYSVLAARLTSFFPSNDKFIIFSLMYSQRFLKLLWVDFRCRKVHHGSTLIKRRSNSP